MRGASLRTSPELGSGLWTRDGRHDSFPETSRTPGETMSEIARDIAVDTSPTAWLGELTARERKTLGACVGGWALDAMDVQLYSFAIPTLLSVFAVTRA